MIYQYQIRLLIVIGESEWFLMVQKIISSLTAIILSILFPLARWATIEMLSNSPPTFPIAPGEWATTKGTPCHRGEDEHNSKTYFSDNHKGEAETQ